MVTVVTSETLVAAIGGNSDAAPIPLDSAGGATTDGAVSPGTGSRLFAPEGAASPAGLETVGGAARRAVGNNIGVTATMIAVRSNAIESFLSIYGTGSKPPGRKG